MFLLHQFTSLHHFFVPGTEGLHCWLSFVGVRSNLSVGALFWLALPCQILIDWAWFCMAGAEHFLISILECRSPCPPRPIIASSPAGHCANQAHVARQQAHRHRKL